MVVRKFALFALCLFSASNAEATEAGTASPTTAPAISNGHILTPKINVAKAPAAPEISFQFTTGPAGLSFVSAQFSSSTTSQTVIANYFRTSTLPPVTHGALRLQ